MRSEMSSATTECVRAPHEMNETPVDPILSTVCNVTFPLASVSTSCPFTRSIALCSICTSTPPACHPQMLISPQSISRQHAGFLHLPGIFRCGLPLHACINNVPTCVHWHETVHLCIDNATFGTCANILSRGPSRRGPGMVGSRRVMLSSMMRLMHPGSAWSTSSTSCTSCSVRASTSIGTFRPRDLVYSYINTTH